jgi:heavy metal sensor kinase
VAGLTVLAATVVAAYAGLVYARARGLARDETAAALRLHASTLSGLLEVNRDGLEFELGPGSLPEYRRDGSGSYAVIYNARGKEIVRSPSLGKRALPPPAPWAPDLDAVEERDAGPDGTPSAAVTRAFLVRTEAASAAFTPPAGEDLRCRIQVSRDVRARESALASLAGFLALAGGGVLLATLGLGLLLARLVLKPVASMTREAATLSPEDPGRRLHPSTVAVELHGLATTLNAALDRLAEALDRQRRFTSDASHELRTPVSVLLAGTELLLRKPRTPEEYREGLERQLRTIRRMKEITENLLALARSDAAAEGPARDPVDLGDVAGAACEEILPLAEEKGLRIEREIESGVRVPGDRGRLARLATNLLSNAVKFTPPGGTVTVRVAREEGGAGLSVADTGPGIPAEHLEHVRERFYRVSGGRDAAEGAGLGLAIADRIARAHGGTLAIESPPGRGALVRLLLPPSPAAEASAP